MQILLTIIIANYNQGHLLQNCLEAISAQSFQNKCEILIIDDCSTDNSTQIIKELSKEEPIRFIFNTKNEGVEAVFNKGLHYAHGEYIHLFAADDIYLPNSLKTILELIQAYPHVSLFSSDYASFNNANEKGCMTKKLLPSTSFQFYSPQNIFYLFYHTDFWIPGHTAFFRKKIYAQYAPQDQKLRSVADWYLNHKIALDWGVGYFPHALIARREDLNSYSTSTSLREKRAIWIHLLSLMEQQADHKLGRSGICRMLGLKAIYRDLLKSPKYWKYLIPMVTKELEKRCFNLLKINRASFWLARL